MPETADTPIRIRPSTHKALVRKARAERLTMDGLIWRLLTAQNGHAADSPSKTAKPARIGPQRQES